MHIILTAKWHMDATKKIRNHNNNRYFCVVITKHVNNQINEIFGLILNPNLLGSDRPCSVIKNTELTTKPNKLLIPNSNKTTGLTTQFRTSTFSKLFCS